MRQVSMFRTWKTTFGFFLTDNQKYEKILIIIIEMKKV